MQMPEIAIIAAMARNRVIGINNTLPWRLPADLQHFKQLTMHKPMVMGRKTWESLPGLLPGRPHIVITRDTTYQAEGAQVAHALDQALQLASHHGEQVMVIGGANLYAQTLPIAHRLYLTEVDATPEGDAYFPDWDTSLWRLVDTLCRPADANNAHPLRFLSYERRIPAS